MSCPSAGAEEVASALVTRAVGDSPAMGNRWTCIETATAGNNRLYTNLGLRTAHDRSRFVRNL